MINTPHLKGPNIRIPIRIPIKGRGFINQGSGLGRIEWALNLEAVGALIEMPAIIQLSLALILP